MSHNALKQKARDFLHSLGFNENEIIEEYWTGVVYREYARPSSEAMVDVAGIKNKRIVIVECGKTGIGKLRTLARHFDEVYHLTYEGEIKRIERLPKRYWWEIE